MHANLHLLSEGEITPMEVDAIMQPFYEENVLMYDEKRDEYVYPDLMPPFKWDYYVIHPKIFWPKVEDCFILIDPDGKVLVRRWWNGKKFVNQNRRFEKYIKKNLKKWKGCYMLELDVHW